MRTRSKPFKIFKKKELPVPEKTQSYRSEPEQETNISEYDEEVEHSNSQLSQTLSVNYKPQEISGREEEKEVISKFVRGCLSSNGEENSRVLCTFNDKVDISGVPGVGKTISVMEIINKIKKTINHRKAIFKYINAMALTTPSKIYTMLNKEIYKPETNDIQKNPPLNLMIKFQEDKRIKFIVIDEVDYLYTKNQIVLYNLFEWCNQRDTRLCAIIIANTMDFPERLMPKLTSRMGQNRLVFKPYSIAQVRTIIEERLMKSNRFSHDAVIYACKKMSSFTSDVRKLLDVLRKALERKKEGIISIEEISKCWKESSEELGESWQENLPDFYRDIINIIKEHGGVSNEMRILDRISAKQTYGRMEILGALKVLEEMKLIKWKEKIIGGLRLMEVTLLKI